MDLSRRIFLSAFLIATLCSTVISSQLYLQPETKKHGYFTDDSFFITCFTTDQTADQLTWTGKDEEITATEGRIHVQPSSSVEQGLELVVEKVEMDDGGQYVCSDVHNSIHFDLIVYKSISFSDTPKVQSASEGKDAVIACHVKTESNPLVSWYHNGIKLENDSKYSINAHTHELTIHSISRADAGIYRCNVYVIAYLNSQMNDFEINVNVEYAPEWTGRDDEEAYASIGSLANISCAATGEPAPRFDWLRDEETIHNSSDFMISHSANGSMLQMRMDKESQFGTYTCRASNRLGGKEKSIELRKGDTPAAPIVKIAKEDQGNVYLSITMPKISEDENGGDDDDDDDDGLEVLGYKVKYALKSDPSNSTKYQDFSTDEEFVLKNMSYSAEYIIQVAAHNAAGHGEYSEEVLHQTQTLQQAPVIDISGATSIKATSALLLVALLVCM